MDNAPQAISLLGCHIFRNLFTQCPNDNVLVSPHAAMIVVSLLMAGAQRTTEREMAEALKVKLPQFHTSMRRILVFAPFGNSPAPEDEDTAFRMANRILVNSNLPLSDSFRKIGQRVYRTLVSPANLARRSAEERRLVNTWAEAITGIKQVNGLSRFILRGGYEARASEPFDLLRQLGCVEAACPASGSCWQRQGNQPRP
ncbi:intracellular coagulation inhibitor 2-like [Dermacentor andersoni]|uniref:intracellular coagulation inhibitor 2-like n=1 Tax=Dermacentor andersoni TaxID=34620 RepID=UPI003B3B5EE6